MMLKNIDCDILMKGMNENSRVWLTWFHGFDNSVLNYMPDGTTERRARAVMKLLDNMGYVTGCHCGCRGDYELTQKGEEYVANL